MSSPVAFALLAACAALLLSAGCGGGGGAGSANHAGSAVVSITWPNRVAPKVKSRLIPLAAGVIVVTASLSNVGDPPTPIPTATVLKLTPPTGSTSVTTATITGLPVNQTVYFTARAYPTGTTFDAAGNALGGSVEQAKGTSLPVAITTGVNTFAVSLDSDVAKIATAIRNSQGVTASSSSITVGDYVDLTATPMDATGATVLVDPTKLVWSCGSAFSLGTFGGGSVSNGVTNFTGPSVRVRVVGKVSGAAGIVKVVDSEAPNAVGAVSGTLPAGAAFNVVAPNTTGVLQTVVGGQKFLDACGGGSVVAQAKPRATSDPDFEPSVALGADLTGSGQSVYAVVPFYSVGGTTVTSGDSIVKVFNVSTGAEILGEEFVLPTEVTGTYQTIARNTQGLVLGSISHLAEFGVPASPSSPTRLVDSPVTFTNIQSIAAATIGGQGYTYVLDKSAAGSFRVRKLDDLSLDVISTVSIPSSVLPSTAQNPKIAVDDEGSVYVGGTNAAISKFDDSGNLVSSFAVTGVAPALPASPGIAVNQGVLYVVDGTRIVELGLTGEFIASLPIKASTGTALAVAFSASTGKVNIATVNQTDLSQDPNDPCTQQSTTTVLVNPQS